VKERYLSRVAISTAHTYECKKYPYVPEVAVCRFLRVYRNCDCHTQ